MLGYEVGIQEFYAMVFFCLREPEASLVCSHRIILSYTTTETSVELNLSPNFSYNHHGASKNSTLEPVVVCKGENFSEQEARKHSAPRQIVSGEDLDSAFALSPTLGHNGIHWCFWSAVLTANSLTPKEMIQSTRGYLIRL